MPNLDEPVVAAAGYRDYRVVETKRLTGWLCNGIPCDGQRVTLLPSD